MFAHQNKKSCLHIQKSYSTIDDLLCLLHISKLRILYIQKIRYYNIYIEREPSSNEKQVYNENNNEFSNLHVKQKDNTVNHID